jgi:hypothetical protein
MDIGKLETSLLTLKERYGIDDKIIDLILGRIEAKDTLIEVNNIIFHIPKIKDGYVLWRCIWPECYNCCKNQARLPLTINDIEEIAKFMNVSKREFIKNEIRIANWQEEEPFGSIITLMTMPALKRKPNEDDGDDGKPITCRFLNDNGYCKLHPSRPGCCKLYPFASWTTINNNKSVIHATFQFDGNCPGFYISNSIYDMKDILEEYSKIIYEYNNAVNRTKREGYGSINIINL